MTQRPCATRLRALPGLLRHDARGAAAIEMAIALPVLLALVMGILSYGDWFLTAHSVQQAANDAARAAIAGLTSSERQQIASSSIQTMLQRGGTLQPANATLAVDDDGITLAVHVRYDASHDPMLHVAFVAPPNPIIQRTAAISLGGL
ncbi:MAG TPA: TadE/TadG family type IV pilus assembly protein [Sphingomonas sp.]|nr:TadE/TadG family type IV pilus assembly protein [Sphingomonas sp.]